MDGSVNTRLVRLVERQAGMVSRTQLRHLGLSDDVVDGWLRAARLHRVHRGVHAYGHRLLTPRSHWWAAVLAGGGGTVLWRRSAGGVWELLATFRRPVEIACPRQLRQPGIAASRARLHPEDTTTHEATGLPVTTVERTLVDLAGVLAPRALERAVDQAEVRRLLDHSRMAAALTRAPGRPGLVALRAVLADAAPAAFTRSELEEAFLAIVDRAGLPRPRVNEEVPELGATPDFHWPELRLIVETDGDAWHATPRRRRADARRDAHALVLGWRTLRFPDADVLGDAAYVATTVASMFSRW